MIDFEDLGYTDITKEKPIHFHECLRDFFDSTYPYSNRFYKQDTNITTELMVGNCHSIWFIAGTCYYHGGWEKFEVCAPECYIDKMFTQTLNAVKLKIKEKIVKHYETINNS